MNIITIGARIQDRYEIHEELGAGGIGVVYRGWDTYLEREVAIKVLSAESLGKQGRARLLHEAQAAASLNHHNIVTVFDAGEVEGIPFIIMELVRGAPLSERIPLPLGKGIDFTRQICKALEYAHSNGIIHRDIKPENVLLDENDSAKLSDFGLARTGANRMTADGMFIGTVFYMAPENILGKPIDQRSDLYSLGVLMYELLSGSVPYSGDDPIAVLSQHLHAPLVPPRAHNPEIPFAIERIIQRLLEKNPEDRFESASEVGAALDVVRSGELQAWEKLESKPETGLLERIALGRMVARGDELRAIREIWQQVVDGNGKVLLISGEPGIGKTRLLKETITQVEVSGGQAYVGASYEEGNPPNSGFAQIIDQSLERQPFEQLQLPQPVLADLLALAPWLRSRFPNVPANPTLDPQWEQERIFESLAAFIKELSSRRPVLLALDDIHWADSGTLDLFRRLSRRIKRQPVLLVGA
jgi:eukaryotic-like serine/threonine-protein kinase